jgi:hypothetical protein
MVEQRGLPHSCLAHDDEHTASPGLCPLAQPIDDRTFVTPTSKRQPPGSQLTTSHQDGDAMEVSVFRRLG